jgi:meso-butanediol dehydrogenase/(S,S)-butanediol dehydrogenase/diacetyl reductase
MPTLQGQACLITGAARGIGSAIAQRLSSDGASVAIADKDFESARLLAAQLTDSGAHALAIECDVTDRLSVQSAVAATAGHFGQLDVMFNNAGISKAARFLETTEDDWQQIMRVNGLGVLLCMQEAAEQMRRQGSGGKIVNTASIAGKEGFPLFGAYSASKFAVIGLTQAGARELAEFGITVNAFCPGIVTTELWDQLDREFVEMGETTQPGEALARFAPGILIGRLSSATDVAGLAAFLASSDSDYITGQSFNVDGGMVFH